MTSQEAKKILALYRPGTADEHDPAFAEALALARQAQSGDDRCPRPMGNWGGGFRIIAPPTLTCAENSPASSRRRA